MADNNYPLAVCDAATGELRPPPGFVATQPAAARPGGQAAGSPPYADMLAVDCEMCYAGGVLAVTRVSLVDATGATVYDRLARAQAPKAYAPQA